MKKDTNSVETRLLEATQEATATFNVRVEDDIVRTAPMAKEQR